MLIFLTEILNIRHRYTSKHKLYDLRDIEYVYNMKILCWQYLQRIFKKFFIKNSSRHWHPVIKIGHAHPDQEASPPDQYSVQSNHYNKPNYRGVLYILRGICRYAAFADAAADCRRKTLRETYLRKTLKKSSQFWDRKNELAVLYLEMEWTGRIIWFYV